jgi:predicted lipoprotein with Yx(FWY)xxD motif
MKLLLSLIIATALLPLVAKADPLTAAPVTSVQAGGHQILADHNQMTAYTFDVDAPGVSKCYDACAMHWPPILVQSTDKVSAPFAVSTRTDGTLQLMYQNHPIYTYFGDAKSGDTAGDGLGDVWHIIVLQ